MRKHILVFLLGAGFCAFGAVAATTTMVSRTSRASDFVSPYNYAVMEPYMNKTLRDGMNPGGADGVQNPSQVMTQVITDNGNTPLSSYVRETASTGNSGRAVVSRGPAVGNLNVARSASAPAGLPVNSTAPARVAAPNVSGATVTRSATAPGGASVGSSRAVVARSGTSFGGGGAVASSRGVSGGGRAVVARTSRGDGTVVTSRTGSTPAVSPSTPNENLTMERCLADYTACMDGYCHRPDAAYDRCYCSPKLAQIDSEYRPEIEDLVMKIAIIKSGGTSGDMTQQELEEYWGNTFSQYTGNNALADLNASLNIDWSDTESRVRGQNAFVTGHDWCIRHISGCFYAADNLRAIYRSSMARDCNNYENGLSKIKIAAESYVKYYTE